MQHGQEGNFSQSLGEDRTVSDMRTAANIKAILDFLPQVLATCSSGPFCDAQLASTSVSLLCGVSTAVTQLQVAQWTPAFSEEDQRLLQQVAHRAEAVLTGLRLRADEIFEKANKDLACRRFLFYFYVFMCMPFSKTRLKEGNIREIYVV